MSFQKYDQCLAVHLLFNHTEVQAGSEDGSEAASWGIQRLAQCKYIQMWVFSTEDGFKICIHLYFYHEVYLSDDESAAILVAEARKEKKKQQLRGCVTWKLAACSLAALNSELVGVYFWGNPDDLTITPPADGLMRLIISAGVTQHLSCDLRAPDEEPRENRRGRASAASKKINFLPDTPARALSVSVCYFPCLFYFNASTLPVR